MYIWDDSILIKLKSRIEACPTLCFITEKMNFP